MMLRLSPKQFAAIVAHVDAERPNEACGLLAGVGTDICRVYPLENVLHSPTAYEANPVEQVAAFLELEAAGWALTGIYHSHPAGPAEPSASDVRRAYYPESIYVILSPAAGAGPGGWQARGFLIDAGQVREVPVVVAQPGTETSLG